MKLATWIKSLFARSDPPKKVVDMNGWREVSPDEVLQPGQQIRMNLSTGKSYVRKVSA